MSMSAEPVLGGPSEPVLTVDNVGQLLQNALEDGGIVGIDEAIEQAYMTKALRHANWLLVQWQVQRWLVYSISEYAIVATGAEFYNVGLGQIVNINPRPERLEYAYMRFLQSSQPVQFPVDIPLDIIPSKEDWSRITVKTIGTLPWRVFYDPQWPLGQLYFWPIPQQSLYEMHVGFKTVLTRFASLTQKINFPPVYEAAMNWNLAESFRAIFDLPPNPIISQRARASLNVMRKANQAIATLTMPSYLRARNRGYDYRGDSDSF